MSKSTSIIFYICDFCLSTSYVNDFNRHINANTETDKPKICKILQIFLKTNIFQKFEKFSTASLFIVSFCTVILQKQILR